MLIAGLVYLSSCNNKSANTNLLITPTMDSVSKGSYFIISYADKQHPTDTVEKFALNDLILNNQAVISMTTTTVCRPPDSLYYATVQITDYKYKKIALNLSVFDSSRHDTGYYKVVNNNSTFTDYSRGENKNFSIGLGSYIHVTHNGSDCMTGTFSFDLYYNHTTTNATGSFKIFH